MAKQHFKGFIEPSKFGEFKNKIKESLKGLTFLEKVLAIFFGIIFGKVFIIIFIILGFFNILKSISNKIYLLLRKLKNKIF